MTHQIGAVMFADIGGLLLLPLAVFALVFWIWMIVDCAKCETEGSVRIAWILVILFTGIVGAPLYFFIRRLPRPRLNRYRPTAPVYQPWEKEKRIG